MFFLPTDSNPITDVIEAPPVADHLTNWGPWAWIGMVVLVLVLAAASLFIGSLISRDATVPAAIFANSLFWFYAWALYPVMRHIPWSGLVWGLMLLLWVVMSLGLVYTGDAHPVTYVIVFISNLGPACTDTLARSLADVPMSWTMFGVLILLVALLALAGALKR